MKTPAALTAFFLALTLTGPMIPFAYAEATNAVVKPHVVTANALTDPFSGYKISVNTTDGGRLVYLFVWQRGIDWTLWGRAGRFIFDTPPILQMSKYFENGTLDFSITYTPLFLLQYNDTNSDGLFNFWTIGHHEFDEEIDDDDVEWENLVDRPHKIYPLAPVFHFIQRRHSWRWQVGPLINRSTMVTLADGSSCETYEYSWNISATIPSLPWRYEYDEHDFEERMRIFETTTVNVSFGYHIQLHPETPVLKYDFNFSGITWVEGANVKLAMISSTQYYSKEAPVVKLGAKSFRGFHEDEEVEVPTFTIAEEATDRVKAFVSYSPNATLDDIYSTDVVKTALQPLFLIPTPILVPEGVCVRGTYPGMEGTRTWRHYIAFAHQLGLPRFNHYVSQDPVIGIVATLSTVPLILPGDLLPLRAVIAATIVATVGFTIYYLGKRRITTPILTPQRP